jgi:hypothetical protein
MKEIEEEMENQEQDGEFFGNITILLSKNFIPHKVLIVSEQ